MARCPHCDHPTAAEDCCAEAMLALKRRAEAAEDDWQKAERVLKHMVDALRECEKRLEYNCDVFSDIGSYRHYEASKKAAEQAHAAIAEYEKLSEPEKD